MALLTVQKPTPDLPLTINYVPASAGGDTWHNTGNERVRLRNNALPAATLAAPSVAPTLAAGGGAASGYAAGTYRVGYAWGNAQGETVLGPVATVTLALNQQIAVSGIPALPGGATFVAIYAEAVSASGILLRAGQTTGTTYAVTAVPTGLPPYQYVITVTIPGLHPCNQGFNHDATETVNAGGAATELELAHLDPFRFNDTTDNAALHYSSVAGLVVAVTG